MVKQQEPEQNFVARRRELLKLGAAGMPMLLTLKASAAQPVHSAFDCLISLPEMCIMVGEDGAAWIVTDGAGRYDAGEAITTSTVNSFKSDASYVVPAGTVPDRYRSQEDCPDPCSGGGGGHDDEDDGWGDNDEDDGWGDEDEDDDCSSSDDDDDGHGNGHGHGHGDNEDDGWGDHDDDDDDGGEVDDAICKYKIYCYGDNTQIAPGNYVSESGNWNISGDTGLYLVVAAKYADLYGERGNFPGVSCLLSILIYLGQ